MCIRDSVFPAIAVAQTLQKEGWEICWLGTKDRMEAQLVPKHGIPIRFIQISGLRGKGIKALLGAPFAILRAVLQARKIIKGAAASNSGTRRSDSRHAACLLPGKIQFKAAAVKACFVVFIF